jgi:hypothetical protein
MSLRCALPAGTIAATMVARTALLKGPWVISVLVLACFGCFGRRQAPEGDKIVATVQPHNSAKWAAVSLITQFHIGGSTGGGHDIGAIGCGGGDVPRGELVLRVQFPSGGPPEQLIEIDNRTFSAASELVRGDFRLAVSPDDVWVALSRDGGRNWELLEPTAPFYYGPAQRLHATVDHLWKTAPTPKAAVLEILGTDPTVRVTKDKVFFSYLDNGFEGSLRWAGEHPDPEVLQAALLFAHKSSLSESWEGALQDTLRVGVKTLHQPLLADLNGEVSSDAFRAAKVLYADPDELPVVAKFLRDVLAKTYFPDQDGGTSIARSNLIWNIARDARKQGKLAPIIEDALIDFSKLLARPRATTESPAEAGAPRDAADDVVLEAGARLPPGPPVALEVWLHDVACFAVQALRWAGTPKAMAAIASIPHDLDSPQAPWPPPPYINAFKDWPGQLDEPGAPTRTLSSCINAALRNTAH